MRKRFCTNEQCNVNKSSSESEQYYNLDNLDLLNLRLSSSSDNSCKFNKQSGFNTKTGAAKRENILGAGSGDGDRTLLKPGRHKTTCTLHQNSSNETSPYHVKPSISTLKEQQEEDRSVLLLYTNRLNDSGNRPFKTTSEEFLLPPSSRKFRANSHAPPSKDKDGNIVIGDAPQQPVILLAESSSPTTSNNTNNQSKSPGNKLVAAKNSFPFKVTPSGNFKVNSQQKVVFESENLSILVANPDHTKVDIAAEDMTHKGEAAKDALEQVMTQGIGSSLNSLFVHRLTDAPQKKEKESLEYEGKATNEILDPEINLSRLGYTSHDAIDWNEVVLPEKKNLYLELYSRITNFTNADCKVYIDNEEFNCHLIVLQCYSEVFHTYVAVKKVELPSDKCSAASFAFIYEWMITGDPSYKDLNRENVLDIFNAAKYLKIRDLIEQCWAFIDNPEVFTEDTAFLLYVDAKEKNLPEVRELMLPRIQKFFLMLVSSQDWLELDLEDVQNFLQSNYICVNCEMEVFMSAVRWLKHDMESREQYRVAILSCVRFGNIAPWQLVDIKRNPDNPDFRELAKDPDICKMIDDGLAFVIIKYWYGQENEDYQHWNSILALQEPPTRNWSGMDKTYFTYREFLIYLDQYRRNQMMEKSHPKERKKKQAMSANAESITPCSSKDKIPPKIPTMDEFLSSRKGGGGGGAGGGTTSASQPKKFINKFNYSCSLTSPRSVRNKRFRKLTEEQAAIIIQTAYRKHLFRKMLISGTNNTIGSRTNIQPAANHFPWKNSHKIINMFKKIDDLNQKYSRHKIPKEIKMSEARDSQNQKEHWNEMACFDDASLYLYDRESILVFGGVDPHNDFGVGRNNGKDIYRYVADKNIWEFVGQMPEPRHHHCCAFLKGRVYVVGGGDPREEDHKGKTIVVDTVWSFDPLKRIWCKEPSLMYKRKNFGLVVSDKYLFAIGGQGSQGRTLATVEKLNIYNGIWEQCAAMQHSRMGVACAKFDEKIWAAGGMSGSKKQPLPHIVECYDIDNDQWTEISKLRHPRCFSTLFTMSNKLYLIGGAGRIHNKDKRTTSLAAIDQWDPDKGEWEKISEMTIPRHGHAVAYLGTQILIIGGVTTIYMRALSNIECFCGNRGSWVRGIAPLPTYLSGHAAITLPPSRLI